MKRLTVFLISALIIFGVITVPTFANDEEDGIEIVTDETYQPVNRNTSQYAENTDMGSSFANKKQVISLFSSSPYWSTDQGYKGFYDAEDNLVFGKNSKYVIDVSEHNGTINWDKVKNAGVDGAILRVGWGYLGEDEQFKRNIAECNRLNIPYGVYLYSYAYDANFAYAEAEGTIEMLSSANVNLSYPIYYDIENFKPWNDEGTYRYPPSNVSDYESVILTYINRMNKQGYNNVHVYSYRYYLQTVLNSENILKYVSWMAAYTPTLGYTNKYYNGEQGWQYTSSGSVNGISGNVDLNCFSNQFINPTPNSIVLDTETKKMSVGSKSRIKANVQPSSAPQTVTWRTGNTNVATIDNAGNVTAVGVGNTYAYVRASNGVEAKCLIKVIPSAQKVSLNYTTKEIQLNSSYKFKATVDPSDASQAVTWRTGNEKVAIVDQNGKVTAKGSGNTYLYAKTWNGKEAKCLIKVTIPAKKVKLDFTEKALYVGDQYKFGVSVSPTNSTLKWRTGNSKVAIVSSDGKVTAVGVGNTYLYVKSVNGIESKCLIKVFPSTKSIKLSFTNKELTVNDTVKMGITIAPTNTLKIVTWRTGNTSVATVDKNGNVKAVGQGNTWLYAKTLDGKEAKCLIQVSIPAKSITLSDSTKTMTVGSSYKIKTSVSPNKARYTYRTGNSKVATVSTDGTISAKGIGNTYLYVRTYNGIESKCLIKVSAIPALVKINYTHKQINLGSSFAFKATILPESANQKVTWRTGNTGVATVNEKGVVTAKSAGNTYLYAKTANGKETRCLIKVVVPADSIKLDSEIKEISIGKQVQFTAVISPNNVTSKTVIWRTGNNAVATVNEKGVVTAKSAGNTYLYAKTANGKETRCLIKVISA